MRSWLKLLIALVVTLPIAGYVAGTMVTNAPADQEPLPPVLMRDEVPPTDTPPIRSTPDPAPATKATETPAPGPREDDDDEVRVVRPEPTRVDDDGGDGTDDERADGDDDGDDAGDDDDSDDGGDGGDD